MRALLILSIALPLVATAAQAETFTFTGQITPGMRIGAPGPMGKPIIGGSVKVEMDMVWASAGKTRASYDCIVFSAPPASGQTIQGVCAATETDGGKYSLLFNCLAEEKGPQSDCWGRMAYSAGKNAGKTGTNVVERPPQRGRQRHHLHRRRSFELIDANPQSGLSRRDRGRTAS
jgi:hypothetical protein